eukprot:TRINITY_DN8290_c0_g1_i1.p1 TRINITY_DN8290_c0_g1~~TRINITY_DN8290_c0_g1_i1.p1  ORF type:complete len:734 (+),score=198.44 TRINITY_DN8290_c0_g1_i1:113-2314(+)
MESKMERRGRAIGIKWNENYGLIAEALLWIIFQFFCNYYSIHWLKNAKNVSRFSPLFLCFSSFAFTWIASWLMRDNGSGETILNNHERMELKSFDKMDIRKFIRVAIPFLSSKISLLYLIFFIVEDGDEVNGNIVKAMKTIGIAFQVLLLNYFNDGISRKFIWISLIFCGSLLHSFEWNGMGREEIFLSIAFNLSTSVATVMIKSAQSRMESNEGILSSICLLGAIVLVPFLLLSDFISMFHRIDLDFLLSVFTFFLSNHFSIRILEHCSATSHSIWITCGTIFLNFIYIFLFGSGSIYFAFLGFLMTIAGAWLYFHSPSFNASHLYIVVGVLSFGMLLIYLPSISFRTNAQEDIVYNKWDSPNRGTTWDSFVDAWNQDLWKGKLEDGCNGQIEENRLILEKEYKKMFNGIKYVAICLYPDHNNKGDSAIWSGEMLLLQKLRIQIVYMCSDRICNLDDVRQIFSKYTKEECAIVIHGGGNFGDIWSGPNRLREKIVTEMRDYQIVSLPQSILYKDSANLQVAKEVFRGHKNLTMAFRDHPSFELAKREFKGARILLVPDSAFAFGKLHGIRNWPVIDAVVLMRDDHEGPKVGTARNTWKDLDSILETWSLGDWGSNTNSEFRAFNSEIEKNPTDVSYWNRKAWLRTRSGFDFLSRGEITISNRLHAHIMSVLLGVQNIIVEYEDKNGGKVSNYHNAWTYKCNVKNGGTLVRSANSVESAIQHVKELKQNKKPL